MNWQNAILTIIFISLIILIVTTVIGGVEYIANNQLTATYLFTGR